MGPVQVDVDVVATLADTMVCTKQFCSYRDRAEDFASQNATVVGISSQSLSSHEEFKTKNAAHVVRARVATRS